MLNIISIASSSFAILGNNSGSPLRLLGLSLWTAFADHTWSGNIQIDDD